MTASESFSMNRRKALIGGAVAAVGLTAIAKNALAAPSVQSGGGIAGGGTITVGEATASFSLFASRFASEDQPDPILAGRIQWLDDAGFGFEAVTLTKYGPPAGDELAREIEGTAKLSTGEEVPFSILARDVDGPGSGKDTVKLTTQKADGSAYEVDGALESGDLQLLTFQFSKDV